MKTIIISFDWKVLQPDKYFIYLLTAYL